MTRTIILLVAVGLAGWLAFGPVWIDADHCPSPQRAQRALAVFAICLSLWLTHTIPLSITGLLAFGLLPLLGVVQTTEEAFRHLGSQAVLFMLGVFLLTAAMISTGLSKRLTLALLGQLDQSPRALFAGVLLASAVLALCMPEHAVAAMMFPVVMEVVHALKLKPGQSNYARLLFLGLAWGAVIGGVGTLLGGARAPLAISLLQAYHGVQIGFLEWMVAAVPLVIILAGAAVLLLPLMVPIDLADVSQATRMIHERVSHMGRMSSAEWRLAILSVATIVVWVAAGSRIGLSVISIISACLLFMLRIVNWKQVQEYINWGILLMYGGAIAIGSALHETQALAWLADMIPWENLRPAVVVVILAVAALILTESISNAATVAVLLPLGYSLGQDIINPKVITLVVSIAAGLPFCLPVSSPPHAIAFSSGYYAMRQACKPGMIMNLLALVAFVMIILVYWPMIGLEIGVR